MRIHDEQVFHIECDGPPFWARALYWLRDAVIVILYALGFAISATLILHGLR